MKKIKKILAAVMTVAMVLGMSMTTFAAPSGKITVAGADGATLKYVKIVEEDRTSVYGWKFVDDIETDFVKAWLNITDDPSDEQVDEVIDELIDLGVLEYIGTGTTEDPEEADNDYSSNGTINSNKAYARALQAVASYADADVPTGGIDAATGGIGLYLITASKPGTTYIPMAAYVGTSFTGVEVQAKGAEDQVHKKVDEAGTSVTSGEIVDYTITTEYPFYPADATNTTFKITDTLENATFNQDTVSIEGFTKGTDYSVNFSADNKTMTIDFTYNLDKAGTEVVVTYSATVGDLSDQAGMQVKNTAKSEIATGYTVAEVISDTAQFTVLKTDAKTNEELNGAEFTLYVADEKGTETIKYNETDIKVSVVESKTTQGAGTATFYGLDPDKTYYVKETVAPEGYSLNDTVYMLTGVAESTTGPLTSTEKDEKKIEYTKETTTTTVTNDYRTQEVKDTKLSALPSTGGIGTTIFTIGGCIIMIAAAGLFFASRRKSSK